jgi:N-acetylneuraminic acid mutarotase
MSAIPFRLFLGSVVAASALYGSAGKITTLSGDITITRDGKLIKGAPNAAIEEKDSIVSKASSSAQLLFSDGTAVSIGANTNFKVQEFLFEEGGSGKSSAKFGVSEGAFKAITGRIGKISPDKFKLETRTATIGIRGTRFLAIIPADPQQPETVACTQGRISLTLKPIEIKTPTGISPITPLAPPPPAPPVIVKAGEMTTLSVDKIETPKNYTSTEIKKLQSAAAADTTPKKKPDIGSPTQTTTTSATTDTPKAPENKPINIPTTDNAPLVAIVPLSISTAEISSAVNSVKDTVTVVKDQVVNSTVAPTQAPTAQPTATPTTPPTVAPTTPPTQAPTVAPTQAPTIKPTVTPTSAPTVAPTEAPPTQAPTAQPTEAPTTAPTVAPTSAPTQAPTSAPTQAPTTPPDTTPPSAPSITAAALTNNNKPTISGVAEAGSAVDIYNGATKIATVTADATTGAYSYTPSSSLTDGTYTLTAKATDTAGNISSSSSASILKIDTIASAAISAAALVDTLYSADAVGGAIKISGALSGDGGSGSSITIQDTKTNQILTITATGQNYNQKLPLDKIASVASLDEQFGINFGLSGNDAAGNPYSASTTVTTSLNELFGLGSKTLSTVSLPTSANYTYLGKIFGGATYANGGYSPIYVDGSNLLTLNIAFGSPSPVSGTALFKTAYNSTFANWNISLDSASITAPAGAHYYNGAISGGWSAADSSASGVVNGSSSYSGHLYNGFDTAAGRMDIADNASTASVGGVFVAFKSGVSCPAGYAGTPPSCVLIDIIPPSAPSITAAALTNNNKPTISGVAEAGSSVGIYSGSTLLATVTADATTGAYSYTPSSSLTDGTYTLTAKATDSAGNVSSASTASTLKVDTVAPTAPTVAAATLTNNNKPTISGTAEAGSSVQIYNGATLIATVTADASTGAYSYIPTSSLTDGTYTLTAKATDMAGNISSSSTVATLKVDTVSTTPTIASIASTSNTKPTITGTAEALSTVTIKYGSTTLGTATADGSGNWTLASANYISGTSLPVGSDGISVTATDTAGNTSSIASATIVIAAPDIHTTNINTAIATPTSANLAVIAPYMTDASWSTDTANAFAQILTTAASSVSTANTATQQSVFNILAKTSGVTQSQILAIYNQVQSTTTQPLFDNFVQGESAAMKTKTAAIPSWSVDTLNFARMRLAAVALQDGSVLAMGGYNNSPSVVVSSVEKYNPTSKTWNYVASMNEIRNQFAASLLSDGSVLAIGGTDGGYSLYSVEKYNPTTNTWSYMAPLSVSRQSFAAATLQDGSVLAMGGFHDTAGAGGGVSSVEKYSPATNTWSTVASMSTVRIGFAAATLQDGSVLAIGGDNNGALSSVEKYNPTANTWSAVASMNLARRYLSAVKLQDGSVLAIAGEDSTHYVSAFNSVEKYIPSTNVWQYVVSLPFTYDNGSAVTLSNGNVLLVGGRVGGWNNGGPTALSYEYTAPTSPYSPVTAVGAMITARWGNASVLLQDGNALVVGGWSGTSYPTSEKYNPTTGAITAVAPLNTVRSGLAAVTLQDGSVLAIGGANSNNGRLSSVEKYNPTTNSWSYVASMSVVRESLAGATLSDGSVLAIGGADASGQSMSFVEKYNPTANSWSPVASMSAARLNLAAAVLSDGSVLAMGGVSSAYPTTFLSSVEKYNPTTNNWSYVASMGAARYNFSATTLQDGSVLAIGGRNNSGRLSSVEKYNPTTNLWQYVVSLPFAYEQGSAVTLSNGKVVLIGGMLGGNVAPVPNIYQYDAPAISASINTKASMNTARFASAATMLTDGSVVVLGGSNGTLYQSSAEKYNPITNSWSSIASMSAIRYSPAAATLSDGSVLALGGFTGTTTSLTSVLSSVEKYSSGTWSAVAPMSTTRESLAAVTLSDGSVLAIGGHDGTSYLSSVEKYSSGVWTTVAHMSTARAGLASTVLQDGSVLAIGGFNGGTFLSSVEKYTPSSGTWSPVASMNIARKYLSANTLQDGSVLAIGGDSGGGTYTSSVEKYNPTANTWQYMVSLPFTYGIGTAVTLSNGKVLLAGGLINGGTSSSASASVYEYTPISSSVPIGTNYHPNTNDGYLIGYENGNMSGNKVVGTLNSMLFSGQSAATGLGVNSSSGELNGNLATTSLTGAFNSITSSMNFSHFDGSTVTSSYIAEDDKVIIGQASLNVNGVQRVATIGFQTLPDKVDATTGNLSSVDDYSSWGYWQTVSNDSVSPALEYHGWWVSGEPTPIAAIQSLMSANTSYTYSGHVLGETFSGATLDPIILNKNNAMNMTVNFGAANPINVTKLQFDTSKGWSYNQSANLTNIASNIAVDTINATHGYTATVGNSVNAADSLKLQGTFYGPSAQSTGGAFAGSLTGVDAAQRAVQGVFKGRR